jgi:SAM-dependent methyltransferase
MRSVRQNPPAFQIVQYRFWDGMLSNDQRALFGRLKPLVDDMNREDDPIIYSWYEHCQWKWKQWEYTSVLSCIDLSPPIGSKVLDAGCGYTPLIRYLCSVGMDGYGFDWDVDERLSSLAKNETLLFGNLVHYHNQDIRAMAWPSDFFDYTISISVLEHLYGGRGLLQRAIDRLLPRSKKYFSFKTIRHTFEELVRVTKPGGLIILTMDCGYGGGLPVPVVEKLLGIHIVHFPDIETIRSYWKGDDYYSCQNRIYPRTPREYTSFFAILRKNDAQQF